MRIAVVGAGAIGGFIGACLARGGAETFLVARGTHLEAMRRDGVHVVGQAERWSVRPHCTEDPDEIGVVDFVILGLKSYAYADAGPLLAPLLGPATAIVPAQNGIPWWYFHRHGGPYDERRIECVDPGGAVSAAIPEDRVIGCVVYPATTVASPGVIRHIEGRRFAIGEPSGEISDRCRRFRSAMTAGGLKCRIERKLRDQIWLKLVGNAAFNPLSALTGATMGELCRLPATRRLAVQLMTETQSVAARLGCRLPVSIEQRLAGAALVGDHRTSMLQDLQAGRRLELDALLGAILELSELTGVEVPRLQEIHAMTCLLAASRETGGQMSGDS